MRTLITGMDGFIGSHLVEEALARSTHSIKFSMLLVEEYARRSEKIRTLKCFQCATRGFPEIELLGAKTAGCLKFNYFGEQAKLTGTQGIRRSPRPHRHDPRPFRWAL